MKNDSLTVFVVRVLWSILSSNSDQFFFQFVFYKMLRITTGLSQKARETARLTNMCLTFFSNSSLLWEEADWICLKIDRLNLPTNFFYKIWIFFHKGFFFFTDNLVIFTLKTLCGISCIKSANVLIKNSQICRFSHRNSKDGST